MTSATEDLAVNAPIASPLLALLLVPLPLGILLACICCRKNKRGEGAALQEVTALGPRARVGAPRGLSGPKYHFTWENVREEPRTPNPSMETDSKASFPTSRSESKVDAAKEQEDKRGEDQGAKEKDEVEEEDAVEDEDKDEEEDEVEEEDAVEDEVEEEDAVEDEDEAHSTIRSSSPGPAVSSCRPKIRGYCDGPCVGRHWWMLRNMDTVHLNTKLVCRCSTCTQQNRHHPLQEQAAEAMTSHGRRHVVYFRPDGKRALKCLHPRGLPSGERRPKRKAKKLDTCFGSCAEKSNNSSIVKSRRARSESPTKSSLSPGKELVAKKKEKSKWKGKKSPSLSNSVSRKETHSSANIGKAQRKWLHVRSMTLPLTRSVMKEAKRCKRGTLESTSAGFECLAPHKQSTLPEDSGLGVYADPNQCTWSHSKILFQKGQQNLERMSPKQSSSGKPETRSRFDSPAKSDAFNFTVDGNGNRCYELSEETKERQTPPSKRPDIYRKDHPDSLEEGDVSRPSGGGLHGRNEPSVFLDGDDVPRSLQEAADAGDIQVHLHDWDDRDEKLAPDEHATDHMISEKHCNLIHQGTQTHQHIHHHAAASTRKCHPDPEPSQPPQRVPATSPRQCGVDAMIEVVNVPFDSVAIPHMPENVVVSDKEAPYCSVNTRPPSSLASPAKSALPAPMSLDQSSVSHASAASSLQKPEGINTPVLIEKDSDGTCTQGEASSEHECLRAEHGTPAVSTAIAARLRGVHMDNSDEMFAHLPAGDILKSDHPTLQNQTIDNERAVLSVDLDPESLPKADTAHEKTKAKPVGDDQLLHETGTTLEQAKGKPIKDLPFFGTDQSDTQLQGTYAPGPNANKEATLQSHQSGGSGSTCRSRSGRRQQHSGNTSSHGSPQNRSQLAEIHADVPGCSREGGDGSHPKTRCRPNDCHSSVPLRKHQPIATTPDSASLGAETSERKSSQESGASLASTAFSHGSAGSSDQTPVQTLPQPLSRSDRCEERERGKGKGKGRRRKEKGGRGGGGEGGKGGGGVGGGGGGGGGGEKGSGGGGASEKLSLKASGN